MLHLKLRLYAPFNGRGYHLYGISTLVGMVLAIIFFFTWDQPLLGMFLGVVLTIVAAYLWCHRLTSEDRGYMEAADYPLWLPLSEEERGQLQGRQPSAVPTYIFSVVMLAAGIWICGDRADAGWETLLTIFLVTLVFATYFLVVALQSEKAWHTVDETALGMEVPVRDQFSVTYHHRGTSQTYHYLVFYLPDGKYVVPRHREFCDTIKLIQYRGMLTYIEYEKNPPPWRAAAAAAGRR